MICLVASTGALAENAVDYNRDIKPLLSDRCYTCHGPDENQRKADLRLDVRVSAVEAAIIPGDSANSELIARISSDDTDLGMPPPESKKQRLTASEIALFKKWIDQGADFADHWAYVKPERPQPAKPESDVGMESVVDGFVIAGLQQRGLEMSREADPRVLVRRLYFDLLGLSPSFAEIQRFADDPSDRAYEQLVDRLLANAHYGERMAMHWLDLVRYADTNGIHGDNHRDIALYRDYVIDAFNNNKRFDQFTIEQLAGDLLPNATDEQKIASGYNRLLMTTREGGAQPKEYLAKYAADRVRNASSVWLGATMGCCECHDHKFDPFTMKDFYSFASFFADVKETPVGVQPPTAIATPEQKREIGEIDAKIAAVRQRLDTVTPELLAARTAWEQDLREKLASSEPPWRAVRPTEISSEGQAKFETKEDDSVLVSGPNPPKDVIRLSLPIDGDRATAVRIEALTDPSLGNKSLGRGNGNFVLTEVKISAETGGNLRPVKIASAKASYEQSGFPAKNAVDGKHDTGWAVEGHVKRENRSIMFAFADAVQSDTLVVELRFESVYTQHVMGRLRASLTADDEPTLNGRTEVPANIAAILDKPADQRDSQQAATLAAYFRDHSEYTRPLISELDRLADEKKKIEAAFAKTLVTVSTKPRMMRILPRGNWLDDSGPAVSPATPEFLPSLRTGDRRANRLDLANWFLSRDNPLTARVFVNRIWRMMFGRGLVSTLDDFGNQGALPSHPELLDWLAIEFIDSGWDVKHIVKLMAMSRTYRQTSFASPALQKTDPRNQWLARQGRFRLDAEMIRDNALKVSGLLVSKIGGGSVKPYQPPGYWKHLNFPRRTYQHNSDSNQYRRGVYTYWCRTFLHPSLLAFDAPSREECTVERPRSNTPLQALVLLNDPTYVEAARMFAQRVLGECDGNTEERLRFASRQVLGREFSPRELAVLGALHERHLAHYQNNPTAADQLLTTGLSKTDANMNNVELAAWTSVARVIFNLHETITRY